VKIPEGYKGVVLDITDNPAPQTRKEEHEEGGVDAEDDEEDDEKLVDIMAVEELASFEEIVVWNHQFTPAETEDPYVRGVQEWMGLAEAVCEDISYDSSAVD
jgi:ribonuclease H2 subunit C